MKIIESISDEGDSCSCCGRSNLKTYVWILDTDMGTCEPYGTSCAALAMGWGKMGPSKARNAAQASLDASNQAKRDEDIRTGRVVLAGRNYFLPEDTKYGFDEQDAIKRIQNSFGSDEEHRKVLRENTPIHLQASEAIKRRNEIYPHWSGIW